MDGTVFKTLVVVPHIINIKIFWKESTKCNKEHGGNESQRRQGAETNLKHVEYEIWIYWDTPAKLKVQLI